MTPEAANQLLEKKADPGFRESLARFGIPNKTALGVSMPEIRKIGKMIGRDQLLAEALWSAPHHESRLLAIIVADPQIITKQTLHNWTNSIYSWDLCDQLAGITVNTPFRDELVSEWLKSNLEFVKRSAIVTLVAITVHDKKLPDRAIESFLEIVEQEAWDGRNFVKKAVNWLLRQIGKRNMYLHEKAIACGQKLLQHPDKSAQWIAKDALKELNTTPVLERLQRKEVTKK